MSNFTGTGGNDLQYGNGGTDYFDFSQGGEDRLIGLAHADHFYLGATFDAGDIIRGGGSQDTLELAGDYSAGVVLTDATLRKVDRVQLDSGNDYRLIFADGNVEAGHVMRVGGFVPSTGNLYLDGSAERDGAFNFYDFGGNDVLKGGAGADTFTLTQGGTDAAYGGDGDDTFDVGGALAPDDRIFGGRGHDTVSFTGDYSAGLTLGPRTIRGVETLRFGPDDVFNAHIVLSSATVAPAGTLWVDALNLSSGHSVFIDGSHEHDGRLNMMGSRGDDTLVGGDSEDTLNGGLHGNDTLFGRGGTDGILGGDGDDSVYGGIGDDSLIGGDGNDTIDGGRGFDFLEGDRGADTLRGGPDADVFSYFSVADSTGAAHDTILDFDARQDTFAGLTVGGVDATVHHGFLDTLTFDPNLVLAVGANKLAAGHAVLFTPDLGSEAGHTFLIVDKNGAAGYQAGQDLVIDVTGALHLHDFSLANFGA